MKVALIRREFITHLDGVNKFIATLAGGLSALGHRVVVLSWSFQKVGREDLAEWFRRTHGLQASVDVVTLRGPEPKDRWVTMMYEWYLKGSGLLKELDVDMAIVNGVIPLRFSPKVAVAHGIDEGPPGLLARLAARALYSSYDKVVCVSRKSEEVFKGIAHCNTIIPIPLKLDTFRPRSPEAREYLAVHIGLSGRKNPHISVEAVRLLRERGLNVRLAIVGGDTELMKRFVNEPFVEPYPEIDEKAKADLLSRARALVLPSSSEAFSYASIEAMASGTPPVVSAAVPDDVVIDNYNGIRVSELTPSAFAKALETLLRNPALWHTLSSNGLQFVRQFDYISVAERYVRLYESMYWNEN